MQDKPSSQGDEPERRRISDEDAMVGRAVLSLVVSMYPARFTIVELARQLSKDPADSAVERAVRDLVGAGLLHCDGRRIMATQIALNLDRLGVTRPIDTPPKPDQNGG